jgi:hypothetical protein
MSIENLNTLSSLDNDDPLPGLFAYEAPSGLSSDDYEPQGEPAQPGLAEALALAKGDDKYLVAIWRLSEGRVHLYRETANFPPQDLAIALGLLGGDLAPLIAAPAPA